MSKNRPINRSPFRRKPWGKKRPTRWNASTNGANESAVALNTAVFPGTTDVGPIAIIADGQIDVEPWADEQEVTIDRIVGSIMFYGRSLAGELGTVASVRDVILKVGIVLNEELTGATPAPVVTHHLFDQEEYEDVEWMYLHSLVLPLTYTAGSDGVLTGAFQYTLPIDIRNRRKIGQDDELAVYAGWIASGADYNITMQSYTDLRCILMSR